MIVTVILVILFYFLMKSMYAHLHERKHKEKKNERKSGPEGTVRFGSQTPNVFFTFEIVWPQKKKN